MCIFAILHVHFFKTSEEKTPINPDKISEEIFWQLRLEELENTPNSVKVVPKQREQVEYEHEKLAGSGD